MGIKNLMKLLNDKCQSAQGEMPLTQIKNTSVAVDAGFFMFTYFSPAQNRVIDQTDVLKETPDEGQILTLFVKNTVYFLSRFFKYGITPIFVFDGTAPPEKFQTQKSRVGSKDKILADIKSIDQQFADSDELMLSQSEYNKMLKDKRKKMKQVVKIGKNRYQYLRDSLLDLGVPCLTATGEGEQLCAMLARDGLVSAVLSTDTDLLALGCHLVLRKAGMYRKVEGYDEKVPCYEYISLPRVLQGVGSYTRTDEEGNELKVTDKGLDLTFEQFQDMCIMAGCDFNTNVYRVGVMNCYKLIKKFGSFQQVDWKDKDTNCLNFQRCLELFDYYPYQELINKNMGDSLLFDRERFQETGRARLKQVGLEHLTAEISRDINKIVSKQN
jgi:flap endonuclease-1